MIEAAISIILRRMPLAEDIVTSRYRIASYNATSIRINETVYRDSLLLSADRIETAWPVRSIDQLGEDSLTPILAQEPAVVLLGTGETQQFPGARIFSLFGERGIGLEVMDNGALCRTFNILVAEDRAVVAAIILPGE